MAIISITPPDLSDSEKTYLASTYTSGAALTVQNNQGFAAGDFVVVGEPGAEKTELGQITSVSGDGTITLTAALKFSHTKDTPVYLSYYNRYELERDGSVIVAGTTATSVIQWDNPRGIVYNDTGGVVASRYRWRFYDSVDGIYSGYSDYLDASGYTRASVGYMVRTVRSIGEDEEEATTSDEEIIRWLNDGQDEISQVPSKWYFLRDSETTSAVDGTYSYALATDFERMEKLDYNMVDGSIDLIYRLKYLPESRFDWYIRDQDRDTDSRVRFYTIRPTGYFEVWPTPDAATHSFIAYYYKKMAALDSYGDETDVPRPKVLEDYAIYRLYSKRGEEDKANLYRSRFEQGVARMRLLNRRQIGQPRSFLFKGRKYEESHYGDDIAALSEDARADFW